jgi:hypothetical protein
MPPYGVGTRGERSDDEIYITESVLLNFCAKKQWGSLYDNEGVVDMSIVEDNTPPGATTDLEDDAGNPIQYESQTINEGIVDIATGYFTAATDVYVNECSVDPASITQTGFTIGWLVRKAELQYLQDVTIYVPGQVPIKITDQRVKQQVITGVYPNSQYNVIVLFHSTNGSARDFHLSVTTANDPANPSIFKRRRGKLRGMEW